MRLVDADVIKAKLMEYIGLTNGFDRAFNETPTIDAVEVVRCKDCIHFDGFDCNRFGEPAECNSPYSDDGNDFCSYGERKESE